MTLCLSSRLAGASINKVGFRFRDYFFQPCDIAPRDTRDALVVQRLAHEFIRGICKVEIGQRASAINQLRVKLLNAAVREFHFPSVAAHLITEEHAANYSYRRGRLKQFERIAREGLDVGRIDCFWQFSLLQDLIPKVVHISEQWIFWWALNRPPFIPVVSDVFQALQSYCHCSSKGNDIEQPGLSMRYVQVFNVTESPPNVGQDSLRGVNDLSRRPALWALLQVRLWLRRFLAGQGLVTSFLYRPSVRTRRSTARLRISRTEFAHRDWDLDFDSWVRPSWPCLSDQCFVGQASVGDRLSIQRSVNVDVDSPPSHLAGTYSRPLFRHKVILK